MLFLSGLLGMMALGSVAIVGTGTFEDDSPVDDDWTDDGLTGGAGDYLPEGQEAWTAHADPVTDGDAWPVPDDGVYDQGRSLFARMGLINLPFDGGPDEAMDDCQPDAESLPLDGFQVASEMEGDKTLTGPPSDLLKFDAEEESLVIVYDDSAGGGDPTLELRANRDDAGVTDIVVDGSVLGRLPAEDAPPLGSIVLVGESAAEALSLG